MRLTEKKIPATLRMKQVMFRLAQLDHNMYRPWSLERDRAKEEVSDNMRLEIRKMVIGIATGRPYEFDGPSLTREQYEIARKAYRNNLAAMAGAKKPEEA